MAKKKSSKRRSTKTKRTKVARRATRMPKIEVAQLDLAYQIPANTQTVWIDQFRSLSRVNRRKYDQGRVIANRGLTFAFRQAAAPDNTIATIEVKVKTAGSTWVIHNSYVKAEAMWKEMQDLVLDDNPSVKGKWHDLKIQLHENQTVPLTLPVLDGAGVPLTTTGAEWTYSVFVEPQHSVDTVTGDPLAAAEFTGLLMGDHTASKKSFVKAYQLSRATVSADQPNVPATFSDSFWNVLTDMGSQEPELAVRIAAEDDNPPYDLLNYPGADANAPGPYVQGFAAISTAEVDGRIGPFTAECGLIELEVKAFDSAGVQLSVVPAIDVILHTMPGTYKGVAAIKMGQ
jgi:hypothetical protein